MAEQQVPRADGADPSLPRPTVASAVGMMRLAIGLLQGLLLTLLYLSVDAKRWPATDPALFRPLLLSAVILPLLAVSGIGHLRERALTIWIGGSAMLLLALGMHDAWRDVDGLSGLLRPKIDDGVSFPGFALLFGCAAGFLIAQALILAGASERRRIASYPNYFETGWKLAIQLLFSGLFIQVLWLVLLLGAGLFALVKLDFLAQLIQRPPFAIPVTACAFSWALHLSDVRPTIVRGIRSLLLVMLSWLLPLSTLLVVCFLLALPWTGLRPLWETGSATTLLLGVTMLLVVFINAAFQDGRVVLELSRWLRLSARCAALCLLPLVLIAAHALGLRVADYGWTVDRLLAGSVMLIALCYACGYAWAAVRYGDGLQPIAKINVIAALLILGVLVALLTPLADPARIAVNSQMARLESGKVSVAQFDVDYLRTDGARYGAEALQRLANADGPNAAAIAERIARGQAEASKHSNTAPPNSQELMSNLRVWPAGAQLPANLFAARKTSGRPWMEPGCLRSRNVPCDAFLIDADSDGVNEVLVVDAHGQGNAALMQENVSGTWRIAALLPEGFAGCASVRKKLQAGDYKLTPPRLKDLEIDGRQVEMSYQPQAAFDCPRD